VRRIALLLAALLAAGSPAAAQKPDLEPLQTTFDRIVKSARGRVGVALIHLETGATLDVRGEERFPMASVVKLPIAIAVLKQVAARKISLGQLVSLGASDMRPCCTLERRHPRGGVAQTVGELLELAIIESDNTAADALLRIAGGPDAVERQMRQLGFANTNVDRSEGQLLLDMAGVVDAPPPDQWTIEIQRKLIADVQRDALNLGRAQYLSDERDTTTPSETAQMLGRLQLGNLLPPRETGLLINLMMATRTGPRRLKARLPEDTIVAHKTGTTAVVINDVGLITLPSGSRIGGHIALAVYVADGNGLRAMERTVAQLGAAAFEFFSGQPAQPPPVPKKRSPRRKA